MTKQEEGKLRAKLIHSMTAIMDLSFSKICKRWVE